jgi:aspartate/methionine/tyrosine aminotransferase
MRFCQMNGLHFISDEVYALSVYETGEAGSLPFCSALSIDTSGLIEADRFHVLYGMSKVRPGMRNFHPVVYSLM